MKHGLQDAFLRRLKSFTTDGKQRKQIMMARKGQICSLTVHTNAGIVFHTWDHTADEQRELGGNSNPSVATDFRKKKINL